MTISERILKVLKDRNMQNRLGLRPVPSANGKKERQILLRIRSWIFVMYCR